MPVDAASLHALVAEFAEARMRDLQQEFVDTARGNSSRRTGELHDGIEADEPVVTSGSVEGRVVSTAPHSRFQDEGTGVYGPTGQRIRPKNKRALAFDSPTVGFVVVASVAGSEPTRFWQRTREAWPQIVKAVSS